MRRISFETAKLAAEKGYDEDCDSVYDIHGNIIDIDNYGLGIIPEYCCPAPYQAELQEWLLKVNIFVSVRMLARDNSGYFFWELFVDNTQIQYSGIELHKTYEEALEAGLYKALKQLI